jgi:hypothetical protein
MGSPTECGVSECDKWSLNNEEAQAHWGLSRQKNNPEKIFKRGCMLEKYTVINELSIIKNVKKYVEGFINTVVPPYPLILYPRFHLSAVYRDPKKIVKLKK